MNLWAETMDELARIEREAKGELSLDQRIRIQLAYAVLSASQEISALNPQNTTYRDKSGALRNGWGLETRDDKFH